MHSSKRQIKENNIFEAAEKVFGRVGFKNSKMEDIAQEAGITKVTLYSYFQSKENLYLGITYRALQKLNEESYATINKFKNKPGIESVVALLATFMNFCEENFLYSEALLDYFALIRSTSHGQDEQKLTGAVKESIYFMKLQNIHNLPFKLSVSEIQRGKEDGSVHSSIDPMFQTLYGWVMVTGYVKVIAASGTNATPLFKVSLKELKKYTLNLAKRLLMESSNINT